jgi:hypothetical protein
VTGWRIAKSVGGIVAMAGVLSLGQLRHTAPE